MSSTTKAKLARKRQKEMLKFISQQQQGDDEAKNKDLSSADQK